MVPSGDTGTFISYSEAEYRVKWRNWDQEKFLVFLGVTGVISELPMNSMDDVGEGIMRYYWDVAGASVVEVYYNGTLLETSEVVLASVVASSYPQGLIVLTADQVSRIGHTLTPVLDLTSYHLGDANYQLNKRIVREILHDNSVKVTEIQEFIPIV